MSGAFPPLFEEQVLLLVAKRTMLRAAPENVSTLVVGSSHGDFGFDPTFMPGSFNLCCRSQDLKHSYHLYRKMSEQNENISSLVIFYSIFSPGSILEHSPSEGEISVALNELFDLGIQYENAQLSALYSVVAGKLGEMTVTLPGIAGFLPDYGKGFMPASITAERRAADHMRFNKRLDAIPYMEMMIDLASRNNHKVLIVLPPARSDFRFHVGEGQNLFESLVPFTAQNPAIEVLDFYHHDGFDDACFGDPDHLVPKGKGTEFLSRSVAAALRRHTSSARAG